MAISISELKINGSIASGNPIDIKTGGFSISWNLTSGSAAQNAISMRVSASSANHGTDSFSSEIVKFNSLPVSGRIQRVNFRKALSRNQILFGQLQLIASDGSSSGWHVFKLSVPSLPFVSSAAISPSTPTINDVLSLNYSLSAIPSKGIEIKWFKNGVEQSIIENNKSVPVGLLSPGDSWHAEIRPFNSFNEGKIFVTSSVEISKPIPVVDQLEILPRDATVDDILEAVYKVSDSSNFYNNIDDETVFDWFVNGILVAENYGKFARLVTNPNDEVYVRAKPKMLGYGSSSFTSDSIYIKKSELVVKDIYVDGNRDGGVTYSPSPMVTWSIDSRRTNDVASFSIKIGTVNGSNEFGEFSVSGDVRSFKIPSSIISSGSEYVVTISPVAQDGVDYFSNYIKFKTNGALWRDEVDNSIGWTLSVKLAISAEDSQLNSGYALIVSDGSYSFRVEFFKSLTRVVASSSSLTDTVVDNSMPSSLLIGVINDSLTVYRNGIVIFNIPNALSIRSTEKTIRFEPIVSGDESSLNLYSIFISTLGMKLPGDADYGKVSFYRVVSLPNAEIAALGEYGDQVLVGVNNRYPDDYPSIYQFNPVAPNIDCDISSFNDSNFSIKSINSSKVGDFVGIGTSRGVTTVSGGNPSVWDSSYDYAISGSFNSSGWSALYDSNDLITFPNGKIRINTKPNTSSQIIPLISDGNVKILSIQQRGVLQSYTFSFNNLTKTITATRNPSFPNLIQSIQFVLSDEKTIEQLASEISSASISASSATDIKMSFTYNVSVMNEYYSVPSTYISSLVTSSGQYDYQFYASASELGIEGSDGTLNTLPSSSRGGAYISQDIMGTPWYEKIDPTRGYTIDIDLSVSSLAEAIDSSNDSKMSNFSFSDGSYVADIQLGTNFIKSSGKKVSIDLTTENKLRLTGKNGQVKIYNKQISGSPEIMSFRMNELHSDVGAFVAAKSILIGNDVHAIGLMSYGGKGNFYHRVYRDGIWIDYGRVFAEDGDFGNFDIDSSDNDIVLIFELAASGRSEIAVARRSSGGWSSMLRITSSIGESKNPKISIDDRKGIHAIWEDNRSGQYRICYAYQSGNEYEWASSAFGQQDVMLTSNDNECKNANIVFSNGYIYVVYESVGIGGSSQNSSINLISKSIDTNQWTGYAGSGAEMQISNILAISPKKPFIAADSQGRIHVVWTALQGSNPRYRMHHRYFNPIGSSIDNTSIVTSTVELKDIEIESVGYDNEKNILVCSMTRSTPSLQANSNADANSMLPSELLSYEPVITYFNCNTNLWKSKIIIIADSSGSSIKSDLVIPKKIKNLMPLIYKSYGSLELNQKIVGKSFVLPSDYIGSLIDIMSEPYKSIDDVIFGLKNEKFIRIGDFGGVLSSDMTISKLYISGRSAVSPLNINAIYSSKYNMPIIGVSSLAVSSSGDVWIAGGNRILFYDSNRDEVFEATNGDFFSNSRLNQYINSSSDIKNIFFDKNGFFYIHLISGDGSSKLIASLGGSYFAEVDIDKNFSLAKINEGGDLVFISNDGVRTIRQFSSRLKNALLEFAVAESSIPLKIDMPDSELLYSVSAQAYNGVVSENGNIYFASNIGLIRYKDHTDISVFDKRMGIDQNVIRFVAVSSDNRIFCATSTNVFEFLGNNFYRIDLFGYEKVGSSIPPSIDGDISGIACLSDTLVVTTSQTAYFAQEIIGNGIGSLWSARMLPKSSLALENDTSSTSVVRDRIRINDIDVNALGGLSAGVVPEIYINGHQVSRGFSLSTTEKVVVFQAPLLPSDSVSLRLRKDIYKITDLKQNEAEIAAIGKESRKILEVGVVDGEYGCIIGGTRSHIDSWNSTLKIPHDDIVLDREAPAGKASISEVVGNNIVKIHIDPIPGTSEGDDPFDAVSGINSVVVSNYDNFTEDGITPSEVRPFNSDVLHTLTPTANTGNLITNIPSGYGTSIVSIKFSGDVRSRVAYSTGSPASVYISDTDLKFNDAPSISMFGGSTDFEVTAMCAYRSKLFVAASRRDGTGNAVLFETADGILFTQIAGVSGYRISNMAVSNFDNKMYIAVSGILQPLNVNVGEVYSYDDNSIQLLATNLNSKANAVTCVDRFVYIGTGSPARIYRYDISSGGVEIVMSESENDVTSLATVGAGVYAGLSESSRIMRSNNPSSEFVQSFVTIANDVVFGTAFDIDARTVPYFSVGNVLFAYSNAWSAVARASSDIVGACINEFGTILYISQTEVKALSITVSSLRYVFVKLIDRAGNETNIRSEPDEVPTGGDGYNDNLTIRISSQSTEGQNLLVDNGLSNTLVEYDLDGTPLFTLPGDSPFYSGLRIEEEMGVYESPILAGASGHIAWGSIQWTGSMPAGTDIEIMLRSGSTREALLSAPYSVRYSWPESGADISFLPGSFIQFQIRLRTATSISPRVDSLTITESAGSTSNVITTMFELPSNLRRGIITTDSQLPSGSVITAAISLKDSTDFAEFQEVPIDRLFEPSPSNNGNKLRIGFKLVSPSVENNMQTGTPVGCNSLPLSLNTMQWSYDNELVGTISADFKVVFFSDFNTSNQILSVDTISSPQLFKIDGNQFPSDGGALFASGQMRSLSLIPAGFPFVCDTCYYANIYSSINGADFSPISPVKRAFKKQCGVNFLDVISFSYQNRSTNGRFHFRISLYDDITRNNLVTSFFSYYSVANWSADGVGVVSDGVAIAANQTRLIQFVVPRVDVLESEKTYYITIQAYNLDDPGAGFSFNDTSYAFRLRSISDNTTCGSSSNVPVIRGFCMMFELEDGRLVKMRFDA